MEKTAVSRPRAADLIPGYRLVQIVGQGGMGEVHRAVQLSLDRTVAVKLLSAELAKDPTFVSRFEKEGAALATLSHPNIVAIVDKGCASSTYYLVMEFIDGPSMRELMRRPNRDVGTSLQMVRDLCKAIEYAHGRGVVHRDLKPENILFDTQAGNIAKVGDFGLAGFLGESAEGARYNLTETHVSMGTYAYMAPEQRVDAKSADHRADIYSLGVILYELLVGEVPIGNFDPPSTRKPGLDKRLDAIVARCLKMAVTDRYQKVSDLLADLEPLVPVSLTQPPRPASTLDRTRAAARTLLRQLTRLATFLVIGAALLVLGAAALRSRARPPRPSAGVELTTEASERWPLTSSGRIDPVQERRRLTLGEGPDTVSVQAMGRKPTLKDGAVTFSAPEGNALVGRALFDADLDGQGLSLSAHAETTPPVPGALGAAAALLLGPPPEPKSALMLVGDPGRYVALIVSASGAPPVVEWALGSDRRGSMTSPTSASTKATKLDLAIDVKTGELSAWIGEGQDRRPVGDSLGLGPGWRRLFGRMPRAAVGCLDGACRFSAVRLVVERELPPTPPPLAEAPPPLAAKEPPPKASPPAAAKAPPPPAPPPKKGPVATAPPPPVRSTPQPQAKNAPPAPKGPVNGGKKPPPPPGRK